MQDQDIAEYIACKDEVSISEKLQDKLLFILRYGFLDEEKPQLAILVEEMLFESDVVDDKKIRLLGAASDFLKPSLVYQLILHQAHEVAVEAIKQSKYLQNKDYLKIIVASPAVEILEAIASKPNLHENVVNELLYIDQMPVERSLLHNESLPETIRIRLLENSRYKYELVKSIFNSNQSEYGKISRLFLSIPKELIDSTKQNTEIDEYASISRRKTEYLHDTIADLTNAEKYLDKLHAEGKLFSNLIIDMLCKGNMWGFLYSLAKISGLPIQRVKKVIYDSFSFDSFEYILNIADIPAELHATMKTIYSVAISIIASGEAKKRSYRRVLLKHLGSLEEKSPSVDFFVFLQQEAITSDLA